MSRPITIINNGMSKSQQSINHQNHISFTSSTQLRTGSYEIRHKKPTPQQSRLPISGFFTHIPHSDRTIPQAVSAFHTSFIRYRHRKTQSTRSSPKKQLHRMVPGSVDIQAGNVPSCFPTVSKIYFSTVDKIRLIFPCISTVPYPAGMIKWSPLCTFSPSTVPSPSRTDAARKG